MKLIYLENYQIKVADEALLVKPIRLLFEADKSKTKDVFYTQCSVIFFMADPRSNYAYIIDEDERLEAIKQQEGLSKEFKIDDKMKNAINAYRNLSKTASSELLEDTYIAISKIREFLRDVNLFEVDDNGKPIYSISSITTAVKQIPQLAKDIKEAEKQVYSDIIETGRKRGGDVGKAMFEDGIDFD